MKNSLPGELVEILSSLWCLACCILSAYICAFFAQFAGRISCPACYLVTSSCHIDFAESEYVGVVSLSLKYSGYAPCRKTKRQKHSLWLQLQRSASSLLAIILLFFCLILTMKFKKISVPTLCVKLVVDNNEAMTLYLDQLTVEPFLSYEKKHMFFLVKLSMDAAIVCDVAEVQLSQITCTSSLSLTRVMDTMARKLKTSLRVFFLAEEVSRKHDKETTAVIEFVTDVHIANIGISINVQKPLPSSFYLLAIHAQETKHPLSSVGRSFFPIALFISRLYVAAVQINVGGEVELLVLSMELADLYGSSKANNFNIQLRAKEIYWKDIRSQGTLDRCKQGSFLITQKTVQNGRANNDVSSLDSYIDSGYSIVYSTLTSRLSLLPEISLKASYDCLPS